jgi:hypothetical protein
MIPYHIHPAAKLLPPMTDEEYANLKADIKAHGLREPITTLPRKDQDARPMVLDGVHRLRACQEVGVALRFVQLVDPVDPVSYVVSRNVHRRHLTAGQRAMFGVKLLPGLERAAKERQRAGGRAKGSEKVRDAGKATDKAAAVVGVSPRYVETAKVLAADAPKLANQVMKGELSLSEADAKRGYRNAGDTSPRLRALRKKLVARGDTPEGRMKIYREAAIKQITLTYAGSEHQRMVRRIQRALKATHTRNPSELMIVLLDYWERGQRKQSKAKSKAKSKSKRK